MRIAHLTATFPPYPGGAGNTAARFAAEQAARGHEVEVFTAPAPGEIPDPGGAAVHRIEPVFAIGNAPLIPSLRAVEGFDVVHLHYPFIFGSELTLLGRLSRRRRSQALLVHYKNRLVGGGVRGAMFEAYEHSVAPALIGAADRVCVLSADHANSVSYLRRTGERDPAKLVEMPNGVDSELFSPAPAQPCASGSGFPPTRSSPRSSPPSTSPITSSASTSRSMASPSSATPMPTSSSPAAASCSRAFATGRAPPASVSASTSSARSLTASCPRCSGPPTCSC